MKLLCVYINRFFFFFPRILSSSNFLSNASLLPISSSSCSHKLIIYSGPVLALAGRGRLPGSELEKGGTSLPSFSVLDSSPGCCAISDSYSLKMSKWDWGKHTRAITRYFIFQDDSRCGNTLIETLKIVVSQNFVRGLDTILKPLGRTAVYRCQVCGMLD